MSPRPFDPKDVILAEIKCLGCRTHIRLGVLFRTEQVNRRVINSCPVCRAILSDNEVKYEQKQQDA